MSMRMMTLVWEKSQHKGSELLLLLAIADNANDQGIAYPSIGTLAKKTRMSRRSIQYLIHRVEQTGELHVSLGTGPRGCNEYCLLLGGANFAPGMKSTGANQHTKGGAIAIAPEPNTEPKREESFSLSPVDLKRLGLTPGSTVWKALLGADENERGA
jgi:helix-turn-helix protein